MYVVLEKIGCGNHFRRFFLQTYPLFGIWIGLFKILFEYVAVFDYVLYSVLNLFSRDFDYIDTTLGTIEVKTAKWYIPLNRLVSKVLQHWLKLAKF